MVKLQFPGNGFEPLSWQLRGLLRHAFTLGASGKGRKLTLFDGLERAGSGPKDFR